MLTFEQNLKIFRLIIMASKRKIKRKAEALQEDETDFTSLPYELKIMILKYYFNSMEKLQLLESCGSFKAILGDNCIISKLNFGHNFDFTRNHLKLITKKVYATEITSLNLNGITWIKGEVLRDSLIKMINLKALYVMDTYLYHDLVVEVLKKAKKIKKLALSFHTAREVSFEGNFPENEITHLYIRFYENNAAPAVEFLANFNELAELWMIEMKKWLRHMEDYVPLATYARNTAPKVTKKIILKRHCLLFNDEKDFLELLGANPSDFVIHSFEDNVVLYLIDFEQITNLNYGEECLDLSLSLNRNFEPRDVYTIRNTGNFNIPYNALYFPDSGILQMDNGHIEIVQNFLFQENNTRLKQLSCPAKLFYDLRHPTAQQRISDSALFKSQRVALIGSQVNDESAFARFTLHTPQMEHFELTDDFTRELKAWNISSLIFVRNWTQLQHLALSSTHLNVRTNVFRDIFLTCTKLEVLKIRDLISGDYITHDLAASFSYAKNLRDFRYEKKAVNWVCVLGGLEQCPRLRHVYFSVMLIGLNVGPSASRLFIRCPSLKCFFVYSTIVGVGESSSLQKYIIRKAKLKLNQVVAIGNEVALDTAMQSLAIPESIMSHSTYHLDFLNSFFS